MRWVLFFKAKLRRTGNSPNRTNSPRFSKNRYKNTTIIKKNWAHFALFYFLLMRWVLFLLNISANTYSRHTSFNSPLKVLWQRLKMAISNYCTHEFHSKNSHHRNSPNLTNSSHFLKLTTQNKSITFLHKIHQVINTPQ